KVGVAVYYCSDHKKLTCVLLRQIHPCGRLTHSTTILCIAHTPRCCLTISRSWTFQQRKCLAPWIQQYCKTTNRSLRYGEQTCFMSGGTGLFTAVHRMPSEAIVGDTCTANL
ncbi:unnamed protein product, partial [Ectocarpus sp. 12 AP-2014]